MSTERQFEFHHSAAENFRERGQSLYASLKTIQREGSRAAFQADRHPAAILTENDISHLGPRQTVNSLTMEVSEIAFATDGSEAVLAADHCIELNKLSEAIQKTPDLRPRVSLKFVRDTILNWLEAKINEGTAEDLPSYTLQKVRDAVQIFEIWIPLANLAVEHEVRLDPVRVRPITKEVVDAWFARVREGKSAEDLAALDPHLERERIAIQGLAAACITLRAERQFAIEKALERAEEVAAFFRLFHPANSKPRAAFFCRALGRENLESYSALVVCDEIFEGRTCRIIPPYPDIWEISDELLVHLEKDLSHARGLLAVGRRTEFQQEVLDAILLYTRSTMIREPADKIVFIFSALESVLLKNESEPIQTHIADRLAFVLGLSVQERKNIAHLVRTCYGFRSKFLHHGRTLEDFDALAEFMMYVWVFFMRLTKYAHQFNSRADFLEEIETRKYSGP